MCELMQSLKRLNNIFSTRLVPSVHYLSKNRGGHTYFFPVSVKSERMPPLPPQKKIDASVCETLTKNFNSSLNFSLTITSVFASRC